MSMQNLVALAAMTGTSTVSPNGMLYRIHICACIVYFFPNKLVKKLFQKEEQTI